MRYSYVIDENSHVLVYKDGRDAPIIIQKRHPSGSEWTEASAHEWAWHIVDKMNGVSRNPNPTDLES